jgi:GNAT superfamily N-acetyltransferase
MKQTLEIVVRPAVAADREAIFAVEAKATPGLRYVPHVFDQFLQDERGAFLVAEMAGEVVACGKFTVVPDGSAWLETLRVLPERQGLGIGKRFYEAFFAIARREGVSTMRMYTGTKNVVSKGLAEHFGFQLAETFHEVRLSLPHHAPDADDLAFQPITDSTEAVALLSAHRAAWQDFLVMNRTFYKVTPALCTALAAAGQVYAEPTSDSVIALGARFMPEQTLHIGLFGGDAGRCLQFALQKGLALGVPQINCVFPMSAEKTAQQLATAGFDFTAELIVMEVTNLTT